MSKLTVSILRHKS